MHYIIHESHLVRYKLNYKVQPYYKLIDLLRFKQCSLNELLLGNRYYRHLFWVHFYFKGNLCGTSCGLIRYFKPVEITFISAQCSALRRDPRSLMLFRRFGQNL